MMSPYTGVFMLFAFLSLYGINQKKQFFFSHFSFLTLIFTFKQKKNITTMKPVIFVSYFMPVVDLHH